MKSSNRPLPTLQRRLIQAGLALALTTFGLLPASTPAYAAGSIDLCVQVGKVAGFAGERLVTAVAVAMAESRCDPLARGVNNDSHRSVDRGLWQINDYWHPEVSDSCAYNAQCNANAAYRISSSGTNWTPWTTYNSGSYRQFIDDARAAIARNGGSALRDVTGDGNSDLLAVHNNAYMYRYAGSGTGGLTGTQLGPGWSTTRMIAVADITGDGVADMLAVRSDGALYRYTATGTGGFRSAVKIWSRGWGVFRMITAADFNDDGYADLLAVHSDGGLYRYAGRSDGTLTSWGGRVGGGWGAMRLFTSGDVNGDGRNDLLAVGTNGDLYFYSGNGNGTFDTAVRIWDGGWGSFRAITAGDYTNDGHADLFAVHNNGDLYRYNGRSNGTVAGVGKVGHGWEVMRLINT